MHTNHPGNGRIASIVTAYIELDKLLKRENLAASGGEARYQITLGLVQVNGAVETRKRRKCYPGDRVEFNGQEVQVVANASPEPQIARQGSGEE